MEVPTKSELITSKVDKGIWKTQKRPPNPFSGVCRHISRPKYIPVDTKIIKPTETKTKFAFISFDKFDPNDFKDDFILPCGQCQMGIGTETCYQEFRSESLQKKQNCQRGLDVEAFDRKLLKCKAALRANNWRHYKKALTEAIEVSEADVVVVNELGIPASSTGPSAGFFRWIKPLANRTSSLVIAGSFHDARTKYNTGYIFTPESPNEGYAFHKQVSATDVEEYISVPPKRQSMVVPAFGFNIGVIICLDLLDYSTVASLVDMRDAIDFILVPSHSEDVQNLERVAKSASQAMPGGVGIVNCNGSQTHPSTMHIFGALLKPVVDKQLLSGPGWLRIYEVDWHWFNSEKKRLQHIQPDLEWLFRFPLINRA